MKPAKQPKGCITVSTSQSDCNDSSRSSCDSYENKQFNVVPQLQTKPSGKIVINLSPRANQEVVAQDNSERLSQNYQAATEAKLSEYVKTLHDMKQAFAHAGAGIPPTQTSRNASIQLQSIAVS